MYLIFLSKFILLGAARALLAHTDMSAEEIGLKAMKIAADKCIYTNHNFVSQKITW
jgi:ATP-dependent HslUV protease subunit HslV